MSDVDVLRAIDVMEKNHAVLEENEKKLFIAALKAADARRRYSENDDINMTNLLSKKMAEAEHAYAKEVENG